MAKIIAIVNQKGGVGKTTTSVSLTAALTEAGQHVLLCDFDPQANATSGMGVDKTLSKGIYEVVIGEVPAADAIVHTRWGDVLPSNKALAGAGVELIALDHRESLLRKALESVRDSYDYILIDCPPSLELLTLNSLCAADSLLVPVQGEYFALEGLSDLMNEVPAADAIVHTRWGDVLPSNKALAGAGVELIALDHRESLLRKALESVRDSYDYILIDCPPSLELLTLNSLCAADSLLVPVQGEYFALEGLSDLMNTVRLVRRSLNTHLELEGVLVRLVRRSLNTHLELEGVLLTMFDGRTNLALQVAEEVKHYFPGKVYATVIPRNVRLSEAPSHGKPITAYDRASRGYEAYTALAAEFLKRQQQS